MIRRLLVIVAWLLLGHAAIGGLYIGLLHVPESTAWTLGVSALLALAIAGGALWVHAGALLAWAPEREPLGAVFGGLFCAGWLVPALVVFGAAWWVTGPIDTWHSVHRGEIDASLMVRFNWAETGWVHKTIEWVIFVLRYVIGGSLALALGAAGVTRGAGAVAAARWVKRALHPVTLALVALFELALIVWPWHYLYWRPKSLPATKAEATFVGVKLFTIALLVAVGWALLLWTAVRAATDPAGPVRSS